MAETETETETETKLYRVRLALGRVRKLTPDAMSVASTVLETEGWSSAREMAQSLLAGEPVEIPRERAFALVSALRRRGFGVECSPAVSTYGRWSVRVEGANAAARHALSAHLVALGVAADKAYRIANGDEAFVADRADAEAFVAEACDGTLAATPRVHPTGGVPTPRLGPLGAQTKPAPSLTNTTEPKPKPEPKPADALRAQLADLVRVDARGYVWFREDVPAAPGMCLGRVKRLDSIDLMGTPHSQLAGAWQGATPAGQPTGAAPLRWQAVRRLVSYLLTRDFSYPARGALTLAHQEWSALQDTDNPPSFLPPWSGDRS